MTRSLILTLTAAGALLGAMATSATAKPPSNPNREGCRGGFFNEIGCIGSRGGGGGAGGATVSNGGGLIVFTGDRITGSRGGSKGCKRC